MLNSLIWSRVVAMQQLIAYLVGEWPFDWANEGNLIIPKMRLRAA
jgi:hypothetical protein